MGVFIVLLITLCAYLIGSLPFGYCIARYQGITDIRNHGSGNIGATNVSRVLGLPYFFLIFFLNAGSAFLFIYLLKPYFSDFYQYIFAVFLLIGNGCSVFLYGSGGKGVATLFGLIAALSPFLAIFLLCIWGAALFFTHTVGIASVSAALGLPLIAAYYKDYSFFIFCLFSALWILWTHRSNIKNYWKLPCVKG